MRPYWQNLNKMFEDNDIHLVLYLYYDVETKAVVAQVRCVSMPADPFDDQPVCMEGANGIVDLVRRYELNMRTWSGVPRKL